jgi:hypothetical protein
MWKNIKGLLPLAIITSILCFKTDQALANCTILPPSSGEINQDYTPSGTVTNKLEGSSSFNVNCGTGQINYSVNLILNTFSSDPITNLNNVDHLVSITATDSNNNATLRSLSSAITTGVNLVTSGGILQTDSNGNLTVNLISEIIPIGLPFLPAGTYTTGFTITVTPQ